jgi:hypothetical protein
MNWLSIAAQCVMCYRTAAAQQAERSRVLNSGIVILLIPPILVLGLILLLAFRKSGGKLVRTATEETRVVREFSGVTRSERSTGRQG